MMNKCAKFHGDSPKGKKVKLNLASAIELLETAAFVHNFLQKPYASEKLRWHIWATFPLNFFMKFSPKMRLYLFYTVVQKNQKWPKTQIKGVLPLFLARVVLPWPKKEPWSRFAAGRTLFHVWFHARSGAISAGQTPSATVRDFCSALIAPDRAWYHTWNSVLLTANLEDGSFFVQGSSKNNLAYPLKNVYLCCIILFQKPMRLEGIYALKKKLNRSFKNRTGQENTHIARIGWLGLLTCPVLRTWWEKGHTNWERVE